MSPSLFVQFWNVKPRFPNSSVGPSPAGTGTRLTKWDLTMYELRLIFNELRRVLMIICSNWRRQLSVCLQRACHHSGEGEIFQSLCGIVLAEWSTWEVSYPIIWTLLGKGRGKKKKKKVRSNNLGPLQCTFTLRGVEETQHFHMLVRNSLQSILGLHQLTTASMSLFFYA